MKRNGFIFILLAAVVMMLTACGGGGGGGGGDGVGGEKSASYTVSTSAGVGGSITPTTVRVNEGETAAFTVAASSGYTIDSVAGCGGTLVGNSYTTGPVTANCTVTVSFISSGLPTLSIADASVAEGDSGTTSLSFTVTLSALANGNVDVSYSTSDGSATADSDYTAVSNGTLTIPAGSTSTTLTVSILGDTTVEGNETLTVTLSSPSANATLGTEVATGTILDDDANGAGVSRLNDTGITTCSDDANNGLTCPQVTHPGQDADYGRDAQAQAGTLTKIGGGRSGFDFTKLDANGNPLADQTVDYTITSWDCVRDNHTGLVWEVKTTDGGLRDQYHTYTWYNSTGINDGGSPGTANGGSCVDGTNCDTEKYVVSVNAAGLCSQRDWRLPTVEELMSLVDSSIGFPGPTTDSSYFPNTTRSSNYWSSLPAASDSGKAWNVRFVDGYVGYGDKSYMNSVRLVRGRQ